MKNKKYIKKVSSLTIATSLFSLGNINQCFAQTNLAQITHNLNLRSSPNANDFVICTLNKGTKVEILQSLGEWTKIKYLNHIGFVSSKYLSKYWNQADISTNENNFVPSSIKIMECSVDILNVKFAPSSSEKILGTLKKGDKVEILYEVNRNWARIKFNNGYGYVNSQFLTEVNSNLIPSKPIVMYCNTSSLNIRKNPSSKDLIVGSLNKNDIVNVVKLLDNGWARIKYNNEYAYVSSMYLSKFLSNRPSNENN